jgi:hypothetical protein
MSVFAPHVPTAAQQTQLAVLKATQASTGTTYTAARASLVAAKIAYQNASTDVANYQSFINGGQKPTVLDEGSADTV